MAANTVHNVKTFFKKISIFDFFWQRILFMPKYRFKRKLFLHILFCVLIKEIWQHAKYMFLLRASKITKRELFLLEFKATANHFVICFCGLIEILHFLVLSFYLLINIYCETLLGEIPLKMIRFTRYIN